MGWPRQANCLYADLLEEIDYACTSFELRSSPKLANLEKWHSHFSKLFYQRKSLDKERAFNSRPELNSLNWASLIN